ncbi:MAG: YfdX protein [Planctomycetota bacterium]|nr:YfdX protein [Planctomycetota bacterium]
MRMTQLLPRWRPATAGLIATLIIAGPAWAQQKTSTSSKDSEPVVRVFGSEGGYRTEVSSQTKGHSLSEDDVRQASLLAAQVFQHIGEARLGLDADDTKAALKEVNKAREAIRAIRAMLPRTVVRTRTLTPDGKAIYEDEREVLPTRIPIYEAILHAQTLAPILAARRNAQQIAGVSVVESESIATEVIADLDPIEAQLTKAAKALQDNKPEVASKALAMALVRGLDVRFNKEDSELASARDEISLARRSLEENNPTQALANLALARERLRVYRELLSQDQRKEVDQMLREIEQLEGELRQEATRPATRADRAQQNRQTTHWWNRINSWFRRH